MPGRTITIPESSPLFDIILRLLELTSDRTHSSPLHADHPDRFDANRREPSEEFQRQLDATKAYLDGTEPKG